MITRGDHIKEMKPVVVYKGPAVPVLSIHPWTVEDMCKSIRTRDIMVKKLIKAEKTGQEMEDDYDKGMYTFRSARSEDDTFRSIYVSIIFNNRCRPGYPRYMLKLEQPSGIRCVIGFNRAYIEAIPENDDRYSKFKMELRLYDGDKLVGIIRSVNEFKCKTGWNELIYVRHEHVLDNGGCLFCDNAVYSRDAETGLIYLKCTKYNGAVLETEYDGTKYPTYCKRRA